MIVDTKRITYETESGTVISPDFQAITQRGGNGYKFLDNAGHQTLIDFSKRTATGQPSYYVGATFLSPRLPELPNAYPLGSVPATNLLAYAGGELPITNHVGIRGIARAGTRPVADNSQFYAMDVSLAPAISSTDDFYDSEPFTPLYSITTKQGPFTDEEGKEFPASLYLSVTDPKGVISYTPIPDTDYFIFHLVVQAPGGPSSPISSDLLFRNPGYAGAGGIFTVILYTRDTYVVEPGFETYPPKSHRDSVSIGYKAQSEEVSSRLCTTQIIPDIVEVRANLSVKPMGSFYRNPYTSYVRLLAGYSNTPNRSTPYVHPSYLKWLRDGSMTMHTEGLLADWVTGEGYSSGGALICHSIRYSYPFTQSGVFNPPPTSDQIVDYSMFNPEGLAPIVSHYIQCDPGPAEPIYCGEPSILADGPLLSFLEWTGEFDKWCYYFGSTYDAEWGAGGSGSRVYNYSDYNPYYVCAFRSGGKPAFVISW